MGSSDGAMFTVQRLQQVLPYQWVSIGWILQNFESNRSTFLFMQIHLALAR
ncbi:hypothetical protein REPUB_Repub17cG0065900 [Reevesia pubescens]